MSAAIDDIADDRDRAIYDLKDALEFHDRVEASPEIERIAVGGDHMQGLMKAVRRAAEFAPAVRPDVW